MHASTLLALLPAVATLTLAAPAPVMIGADDVILHGNGRFQVMKRDDFEELEKLRMNNTVPPMPGNLDTTLFHGPPEAATLNERRADAPLQPRAGGGLIIPNPQSRFLGWDVLMSSVVRGAPTQVTIGTGYEISNSISVGVSTEFQLVKDFLSASMSVNYENSWTSSQTQQFMAEVPAGKFGAFVSNPWTTRASGNVFRGTIGGKGSLTYYQGDSFQEKGYGNMKWVDGVITLCVGNSFPLKRCLGQGTL